MEEIFANISGFPNYQVSNLGNVKNVLSNRILQPIVNNTVGYHVVSLFHDGEKCSKTIHKMVCTLFVQNPENKEFVDHIDRNRFNNRYDNLRWVTRTENNQNKSMQSNNKSGIVGVSLYRRTNKWRASISVNKVSKHLGCFVTKEDAIRARQEAEIQYFGEFRPV